MSEKITPSSLLGTTEFSKALTNDNESEKIAFTCKPMEPAQIKPINKAIASAWYGESPPVPPKQKVMRLLFHQTTSIIIHSRSYVYLMVYKIYLCIRKI